MRIAIVKDSGCNAPFWFKIWEALCWKSKIECRIFNSESEDFLLSIIAYNPDKILWRSAHHVTAIKRKDEWQRQTLESQTNLRIVPNWNTHYFYDHKVLQTYLFQIHEIPHPKTHIFFRRDEAYRFLQNANYPIVVKTDAGAGSAGVRFPNNFEEAVKQLEENFTIGLKYYGERREKNLFYTQEYIPTSGIFRIVMIGRDVGYSFYQSNKPGTKIASSQGFDSYPETPIELLNLCSGINSGMAWDYMMYDCIWDEKVNQWLILELTDTCGWGHSNTRKITHYLKDGEWANVESNASPPELIFNKYILSN